MSKQIKPAEAVELCNNYDSKYAVLTKQIKKDDNRSCSFSIKDIEEYIAYLKESKKDIDGLRVYLGSNNDSDLTTMFIAPTSKGIDNTTLNVLNRFANGLPPKKKYTI